MTSITTSSRLREKTMPPEVAATFEQLRERSFKAGAYAVGYGVTYCGPQREVRFSITIEANGWERQYWGKTLNEVFRSVEIYLDERGIK